MKNIIYLLLLVFITTTRDVKSQETDPLDFFPHNVGNLWQYITYTQTGSEFFQVMVIAVDTTWADSSVTITKNNGMQDFYLKYYLKDSLKIYQQTPGGWGILYDLGAEINSFWISDPYFPYYTKYIREYEEEVFNDSLIAREYWTAADTIFNFPLTTDKIAFGIGSFESEFEVGITVLNGCIINGVQYGIIISVDDKNESSLPSEYILNNFPNPFNSQTTIHYYLPSESFITINIYDILGTEVEKIFEGKETAGHHYKIWHPKEETSGLYFVVMRTNETLLTHKVLFLK